MSLIQLYNNEIEKKEYLGILMFFVSSAAAVVILVSIITFSSLPLENLKYSYLFFYLFFLLSFIIGKKVSFRRLIRSFVYANHKLTKRVSNKIRQSNLSYIEKLSHTSVFKDVSDNNENFVESITIVLNAIHSSVVVVFVFFYMLFISIKGFLICTLTIGLSIYLHTKYLQKDYQIQFNITKEQEKEYTKIFHQLLCGFKELKINSKMSNEHFESLKNVLNSLQEMIFKMCQLMINNFNIFFDALLLGYLGVITFVLPKIATIDSQTVSKILIIGIFLNGPVGSLFAAIPFWIKSNQNIAKIYQFEIDIDKEIDHQLSTPKLPLSVFDQFKTIQLQDIIYDHYNNEGEVCFSLGPINSVINRGEIIFIVGGNGSGKTTLMKILSGLYKTSSGEILIDGNTLKESMLPAYHNLFSTIMSDYYLFNKLYGLEKIDDKEIASLLKLMRIETKTAVVDKTFTNTRLSTGQRKRLAMIVALLHDKPFYLFDEWAADQDVSFRKYFYEVLLKDLKNKGKTVVAISHDDRFYHVADKIIKLEYGKEVPIV
ncbi:cyclic peptide transporter [Candidatus Magnetomorum sp. HK-1]|nr:cyclic peptide transporter [Candidatus Magnetomorum sp. HK-1]